MPLVDGDSNPKTDALSGGRKGNATKLSFWIFMSGLFPEGFTHSRRAFSPGQILSANGLRPAQRHVSEMISDGINITIKIKHCSPLIFKVPIIFFIL